MRYRVRLIPAALEEIEAGYRWISRRTVRATAWYDGLVEAIDGLEEMPERWPEARERAEVGENIRPLLYGKSPHVYRVLFIVRRNLVVVLHVCHAARRRLNRRTLILPPDPDNPRPED